MKKRICQENSDQKRTEIAAFITDFRLHNRNKSNNYQEYNHSEHAFTYQINLEVYQTKLTRLQGEIHKSIITSGDFNILIAVIDPSNQKTSKGLDDFDNSLTSLI